MKNKNPNKLTIEQKRGIKFYCIRSLGSIGITHIDGRILKTHRFNLITTTYTENFNKNPIHEWKNVLRNKKRTIEKSKRVEKEKSNPGIVYFFINEKYKFCKIGFSINPHKRIGSVQTGCPFPLRMVAALVGDISTERQLHKKYRKYKSSGEWFRLEGDLELYVRHLRETSDPIEVINNFILTQNIKAMELL